MYIDGQNDNPKAMPGNIYQWIGSFEAGDGLFIQDGLAVLPENKFQFFAYNQTQAGGGLAVTCELGMPAYKYGSGDAQGCLAPLSSFNTSVGSYAYLVLYQVGQTIYFYIYTDTWHLLMSLTDTAQGANGFQPAFLAQEYTAYPESPDITTLVFSDKPALNMRDYYGYTWHDVNGTYDYTISQTATFDYYQLLGTNPQSYSGPNPVCPPFEQFGVNNGSYSSYYVGNYGASRCPPTGTGIS